MKGINRSMVCREVATLAKGVTRGSVNRVSSCDGHDGGNNRTYDLKIMMKDSGKESPYDVDAYIDKTPSDVYNAFVELVQQGYYIRYVKGEVTITKEAAEPVSYPVTYVGTCEIETYPYPPDGMAWSFRFSAGDLFELSVYGSPSSGSFVRCKFDIVSSNAANATQYNNEDLGSDHCILNITIVWGSLDG